jgi:hypothetical protein
VTAQALRPLALPGVFFFGARDARELRMADQKALFSPLADVDFFRHLLVDLHDDLAGKVARFRQLADLSMALGSYGSMIPGGESAHSAWLEARSCFVHDNFVATIMLCHGMAEHMLAAHLVMGLSAEELPERIKFSETLRRCVDDGVITERDAEDLLRPVAPLASQRDMHSLIGRFSESARCEISSTKLSAALCA